MKTTKEQTLIDFSERLNEACDYMGVPGKGQNRQAAVATLFGVSQKGSRKWLEGEGFPTFDKVIQIAEWSGFCVEWLLTGRGERNSCAASRLPDSVPDDVARVAGKIAALNPTRRAAIDQLLDAFSV